ncbi:MAG: hypothetical protein M3405_13075 [Acidobacteriota bacterium]|jgi:ribosomal protein L37AE/L43A|nr:hypothetical protein [Acidobacteriota bacterium]
MNKIIDENHVCTFCDSDRKPITDGIYIYCPTCQMPQFEGVTYEPDQDCYEPGADWIEEAGILIDDWVLEAEILE